MSLFETLYHSADKHLKDSTLDLMKVPVISRATLLDVGCGDCDFTQRMAGVVKPIKIIVVDSVKVRLEHAQELGYEIVEADLNSTLPFPDNSIDVIHVGDVIEHLNNTDTIVKEIKRVLTPVGYAIISTPNLASWHNIFALVRGRQPMTCMISDEVIVQGMQEDDVTMPKHRRIFTLAALKELVKYHRLKITDARGCGYYPFTGIWQSILSQYDWNHAAYALIKVVK
jgi:ubiquinone/menaquinone biosynthesis C-methylase UbiE